jgi:hypothetical protein
VSSTIAKVGMKPPHPGAFIREEILELHGLNVSIVARMSASDMRGTAVRHVAHAGYATSFARKATKPLHNLANQLIVISLGLTIRKSRSVTSKLAA